MTLRPRAIDCPSCGASVGVRHAVKAKSVVCSQCGAQLDLTKPGFEILSKGSRAAEPPVGFLRLGMQGTLDGATQEVIGRIRYREQDWFWDEWLLVSEAGKYAWVSEDEGKFKIHRAYVPKSPVAPDMLTKGARIFMDQMGMHVREAGVARIAFVEGELTWKARLGETVHYADAGHGLRSFAFEWTDDEFEVFQSTPISRGALRAVFGQERHAKVDEELYRQAGPLRTSGIFLVVAAVLALLVWLAGDQARSVVTQSKGGVPVLMSGLTDGVPLDQGGLALTGGLGFYELEVYAQMTNQILEYTFELVDSSDTSHQILVLLRTTGASVTRARQSVSFKVDKPDTYRLRLRGKTNGTAPPATVVWKLYRRHLATLPFLVVTLVLGCLGLWSLYRYKQKVGFAGSGDGRDDDSDDDSDDDDDDY